MRKLIMLAAMLAMMLVAAAPAMAAGGVVEDLPAEEGVPAVPAEEGIVEGDNDLGAAGAAALSGDNGSSLEALILAEALAGNDEVEAMPATGGPSPAVLGASALLTGGGLLALGGTMIARRKNNEMA